MDKNDLEIVHRQHPDGRAALEQGRVDAFTHIRLQDLIQQLALEYEISILLVTHDLDEAFYLSDRVLLLGGTPSRLRREFPVPLPRPRDRRAVELAYLCGEALTELQQSLVI